MDFQQDSNNKLRQITYDRLYSIYGPNPPKSILKRIEKELECIKKKEQAVMFLVARELTEYSHECGYPTSTRGSIAASLVAFLLGITEINPLPPHYLCPKCKRVEFIQDERCAVDLYDKACPDCGTSCLKIGFDIPMEECFGYNSSRLPEIELLFTKEQQKIAIEKPAKLYSTENSLSKDGVSGENGFSLPTESLAIRCFTDFGLSLLARLPRLTGVSNREIPFNNPLTMALFRPNRDGVVDTSGIPNFDAASIRNIFSEICPADFESIIHATGMGYGSECWEGNGENLFKRGYAMFDDLMSSQADILRYLTRKNLSMEAAYQIMERALSTNIRWMNDWTLQEWELFSGHSIPDWYVEHISKIRFLITRAQCVEYAVLRYRIGWYKANFPAEFHSCALRNASAN